MEKTLKAEVDELVRQALAHKKRSNWTAESNALREAAAILNGHAGAAASKARRREIRAAQNELQPGTMLAHRNKGKITATCIYVSDKSVVYEHAEYASLRIAALAACRALGMSTKAVNAWQFWGIEKREY